MARVKVRQRKKQREHARCKSTFLFATIHTLMFICTNKIQTHTHTVMKKNTHIFSDRQQTGGPNKYLPPTP